MTDGQRDELYQLSTTTNASPCEKNRWKRKLNFYVDHLYILSSPKTNLMNQVIRDWQQSAELFLGDYELGKKQGRYQAFREPSSLQSAEPFDLLLSTDWFFHTEKKAANSPQELMNELCQVASEVRIFPISA